MDVAGGHKRLERRAAGFAGQYSLRPLKYPWAL